QCAGQFSRRNQVSPASLLACVAAGGADLHHTIRTILPRRGTLQVLDDGRIWTDALLPAAGDLVGDGKSRNVEGATIRISGIGWLPGGHLAAGRSEYARAGYNRS